MGGFLGNLVSNPLGAVSDLLHDPLGAANDLLDSVLGVSDRTYVNTAVSRVIQDSLLPDSIRTGTIKSVLAPGDVPDYVMEELVSSIGLKAEQMFAYASNKYTHGLPSGQYKTAVDGRPEAVATLSAIEGADVLIDYCHFRSPNALHIGWLDLIAKHGYNTTTNQLGPLSVAKGSPVYLDNMVVVVPPDTVARIQAGALDQWGIAASTGYTPQRKYTAAVASLVLPSPVQVDPTATSMYLRVDYTWEEYGPDFQAMVRKVGSFVIAPTGFNDAGGYFHVKYRVNDVVKYWMYLAGSGTYPALDAVYASEEHTNGTFFPITYFRHNGVSGIADKTTSAYTTTKRMVKYLGMDYGSVAAGIESNPNVQHLNQAMMIMAVPANTSNALEQAYLFEFFDALFSMDPNQFATSTAAGIFGLQAGTSDSNRACLIIQDKQFKLSINNSGIVKRRVGGNIGAIGSHLSGTVDATVEQPYTDESGTSLLRAIPSKNHYFRRQVSHSLYDEITVSNLSVLYHLLGGYTSVGSGLQNTLLIPLDRAITRRYSIPEREILYSRSLHYVMNSRQTVTTHWYQTDMFKFIATIAAIVITVKSFGKGYATLAAAAAIGTTALVWAVFTVIIVPYVIAVAAYKLFVKVVGAEAAMAIAVIAAAYSVYDLNSGAAATSCLASTPWSEYLLQASSGLMQAITADTQAKMQDLLAEYATLHLLKDETTKTLEAANKLLEHNNWLNPFVIFGEKPDDYYNRTVHAGNVGVLGIGAISSYVDTALTLPKLDETIEG